MASSRGSHSARRWCLGWLSREGECPLISGVLIPVFYIRSSTITLQPPFTLHFRRIDTSLHLATPSPPFTSIYRYFSLTSLMITQSLFKIPIMLHCSEMLRGRVLDDTSVSEFKCRLVGALLMKDW
mgnify:FL=1